MGSQNEKDDNNISHYTEVTHSQKIILKWHWYGRKTTLISRLYPTIQDRGGSLLKVPNFYSMNETLLAEKIPVIIRK